MHRVEDVPRIEIRDIRPSLPPGARKAAVQVDVEIDGRTVGELVALTSMRMSQGRGRRWWWSCPRCGQRCSHLYLGNGVACRRCSSVAYTSQYQQ